MRLRSILSVDDNQEDVPSAPPAAEKQKPDVEEASCCCTCRSITPDYATSKWGSVEVRKNSFNLPVKSRWVTVVYAMLLAVAIILIPVQNRTGLAQNTRRLQTPLTQTVGIWTPVSIATNPLPFLGADMTLNGKCGIYNGANTSDGGYYLQTVVLSHSTLDSRYLVLGCLVSAFLFQLFGTLRPDWYEANLSKGGLQFGPFFERSVSVSLMMVAMSAQVGITDVFTLLNVMINAWASMLFSFFAEVLFEQHVGCISLWERGDFNYHGIAMAASWVTLTIAMCTLYSKIAIVDSCFNVVRNTVPVSLAVSVVYIELLLIGLILFLQTLSLYFKPKPVGPSNASCTTENFNIRITYTYRLEYMYLVLDLLSKFSFCFLLYTDSLVY